MVTTHGNLVSPSLCMGVLTSNVVCKMLQEPSAAQSELPTSWPYAISMYFGFRVSNVDPEL